MTVARAFPYLRYNPDEVGDPGQLLAPPYDVIDERERARLAATAPYQSVLLELPEGGDNAVAGRLLREWIDDDVLEAGEVGIAVVQQRYTGPDGVRRTRIGVECEVELAEFSEGRVLPHEQTFEAPRRTRLDLMEKTGANVSPVFMVYHDPARSLHDLVSSITDDTPDFTSNDPSGTQTAVWFVTDPALCEAFEQAVAPHPLLIADGHHRYTAALAYRDQVRAGATKLSVVGGTGHDGPPHTTTSGPNGVLTVIANSADEGILVFPTHRVLSGVAMRQVTEFVVGSGAFTTTSFDDVNAAMSALERLDVPGFVVYHGGEAQLFAAHDAGDLELANPGTSDWYRSLDVVALHSLLIDGGAVLGASATDTHYTRSLDEAIALVDEQTDRIGFLLRSVDVAAIHGVAQAGELLPQKSTYFYPKVPTGVVFRQLG